MSKILIVEDESILSDVYEMILTLNGFTTKVAVNGIDALQKIPDFGPDLILLDLLMPRMDGITFLNEFKSLGYENTKIIVYSNLFDRQKEQHVRSLGAADIVLKSSVTPVGLVDIINGHLKN